MPKTGWHQLDVSEAADSYQNSADWSSGRMVPVDASRKWSFKDRAYKRDRKAITDILAAFDVSPQYQTLTHVHILAARWQASVEALLWDITLCFNKFGREYTAYRYRFSEGHEFDWLPRSGKSMYTGIVWHPGQKAFVLWKPGSCPADWQVQRELRLFPDKLAATKLSIRGNLKASRKPTHLLCEDVSEYQEELAALLASTNNLASK